MFWGDSFRWSVRRTVCFWLYFAALGKVIDRLRRGGSLAGLYQHAFLFLLARRSGGGQGQRP